MVIKLHEFAEAEIARRVQQIAGDFRQIVPSIYALLPGEKIEHLGSEIIGSIRGKTFLLTAAHLVESGRKAADFVLVSENSNGFVSLSRRFLKSSDDSDLAICALTESDVDIMGVRGLDFELFLSIPPMIKGRGVATIGWPNSKNELSRYKKTTPTQMLISGPSITAEDLGLAPEFDQRFAYQRYRTNDSFDETGSARNPPKLRGLSGGLTVDVGDPIDSTGLSGNLPASWHPIGVFTDHPKSGDYVRSTRPWKFLRDCIQSEDFKALHTG